jgi:hypothetical protein
MQPADPESAAPKNADGYFSFKDLSRVAATADGELGGRKETAEKIRSAIEIAGIEFIQENGGGAGVRLRKRQRSSLKKL